MPVPRVPIEYNRYVFLLGKGVLLEPDEQFDTTTTHGFAEYLHQKDAPASLCEPAPMPGDPRREVFLQALQTFERSLCGETSDDIIAEGAAECFSNGCPERTSRCIAHPVYRLHRDTYGHTPAILVFAFPVCVKDGHCTLVASDFLPLISQMLLPRPDKPQYGKLEGCRNCDAIKPLQVCVTCDAAWYCSKECQKLDQTKHNIVCNIFRREREMNATARVNAGSAEVEKDTNKVDSTKHVTKRNSEIDATKIDTEKDTTKAGSERDVTNVDSKKETQIETPQSAEEE
ncbi:hypothetical protein VTL71DRAFT_9780 [Oculimacula yallundae]|uniref:MYND-type domain-containing protein n=1 Tax=Oculimacula yallundae TaxID=86028 RepID=A0ABR4BRV8_9HELO